MNHLKKSLILFTLLSCIGTLAHPESPDQKPQPDSASIIEKYKMDSIASAKAIDSLKKIIADNDENAKPDPGIFAGGSIAIYLISIAICVFLIYIANTSPKDLRYALGLPDGSVRAIIAILAIVFYISVSIALSHLVTKSTIPADVTKTLGTLVVAISTFYFGSKTAEQGNKTATENLTALLKNNPNSNNPNSDGSNPNSNPPGPAPANIIQQAITDNKKDWMVLYKCTDIQLGKKKTDGTIQDIDCIVFFVDNKAAVPVSTDSADTLPKPIPPNITYSTQGKNYKIPTDVRQNPA